MPVICEQPKPPRKVSYLTRRSRDTSWLRASGPPRSRHSRRRRRRRSLSTSVGPREWQAVKLTGKRAQRGRLPSGDPLFVYEVLWDSTEKTYEPASCLIASLAGEWGWDE